MDIVGNGVAKLTKQEKECLVHGETIRRLRAERDALQRKYKRLKSLVTEYLPCDLTVAKNAIDVAIAKHNKRVLDLERGE